MKAILIQDDNSLLWTDVPDPIPADDEVLIDIHACALNRADLLQRAGNYPPPPGCPEWMGLEVAGVIEYVGPAAVNFGLKAGDEVCALLGGGGYAEKVAVNAGMCMPIPKGFSMAQATAIPEVFATAYLNLIIEGGLKKGERVFIQAGASGLGLAAIQMAKHYGAEVMTTVSSDRKAKAVLEYGADIVINRKTENIGEYLDRYPTDLVLDCVGGPDLGPNFGKLARGGRWIMLATLGGTETVLPLRELLSRGIRLIGSTLRSRHPSVKVQILRALRENFWPGFESGEVKPVIYKILPITEAEEAHRIMRSNENIGKIILTVK